MSNISDPVDLSYQIFANLQHKDFIYQELINTEKLNENEKPWNT